MCSRLVLTNVVAFVAQAEPGRSHGKAGSRCRARSVLTNVVAVTVQAEPGRSHSKADSRCCRSMSSRRSYKRERGRFVLCHAFRIMHIMHGADSLQVPVYPRADRDHHSRRVGCVWIGEACTRSSRSIGFWCMGIDYFHVRARVPEILPYAAIFAQEPDQPNTCQLLPLSTKL